MPALPASAVRAAVTLDDGHEPRVQAARLGPRSGARRQRQGRQQANKGGPSGALTPAAPRQALTNGGRGNVRPRSFAPRGRARGGQARQIEPAEPP